MALISCPECEQQVSDKSSNCIHCGYPVAEHQSNPENYFETPTYPTKFSLTGRVSGGLVEGSYLTCHYPHELNEELLFDEGKIALEVFENGISFFVSILERKQIHYSQIVDLKIEEVNSYSDKNKSVLGRAVVGGVLLGGVGAVVGGLSGQGKKSMRFDRVISIIYHENQSFHQMILPFQISKDGNRYLSNALNENYKKFFKLDDEDTAADKERKNSEAIAQEARNNVFYGILFIVMVFVALIINWLT